ncbi:MAG: ribosomal RNA small subunit methyltransferase A [Candidatus Kerfeldbacteria bacterium]|nr:ribosomal RNA small subunit methyltransferase A [Candidatus Kerfeldbacteria bacterium]
MTRDDVQRILRQIGLRPQQAAGQNFLLNDDICQAMVDAAGVGPDDTVLEIGPGLGCLTDVLLATGARVVAVELDKRLAAYLRRKYRGQSKLILVEGDIFRVNLNDHLEDQGYKLVANLPYSGTSLIFRNFLTLRPRPTSLTTMIQSDVAKRITAEPGEMSLLSLLVQYYSVPHILMTVPATDFFPIPRVQSAVLHCEPVQTHDEDEAKQLFRLARAGFASRRKQLHNSLASSFHLTTADIDKHLDQVGIKPSRRAQELSVAEWLRLAKELG